jgi:hypothetical protein
MRPSQFLRDIAEAETVDELRGVLGWLQHSGALRDPDERTRLALARLDQRARDLAAVEALLARPD